MELKNYNIGKTFLKLKREIFFEYRGFRMEYVNKKLRLVSYKGEDISEELAKELIDTYWSNGATALNNSINRLKK